jgi:hypothetical protein
MGESSSTRIPHRYCLPVRFPALAMSWSVRQPRRRQYASHQPQRVFSSLLFRAAATPFA